jgi:hypothetical protein
LSRDQYVRSLEALFGASAVEQLDGALGQLSVEASEERYGSEHQTVSVDHAAAWAEIAWQVGGLAASPERRIDALGECLSEEPLAEACIADVLARLGRRAYRRPPTERETVMLRELYDEGAGESPALGLQMAVAGALQAPGFLYQEALGAAESGSEEAGGSEGGGEVDDLAGRPLTSHQLAERMAFLLWGAPPDAELARAADEGTLSARDELRRQAERMLQDRKARRHLTSFVRAWLGLDHLPPLNQTERIARGVDLEALREASADELVMLLEHLVFEERASFRDLMTTQLAALESEELASVYGESADLVGAGPVPLDPADRAGLVTRVAPLLSQGNQTQPILRGAFFAKRLLCIDLHPPSDPNSGVILEPPPFDPSRSNRERWEAQTASSDCRGCHAIINPLGFAAEGYDPLGRVRSREEVIDPLSGEVVATHPVRTDTEVHLDGETQSVPDLVALAHRFAESRQAQGCFVEQWSRFAAGRAPGREQACLADELRQASADESVLDMFIAYVLSPEFRFAAASSSMETGS